VAMYENSLILRITMTKKPFPYKKAFTNIVTNFMFYEEMAKVLPFLLKHKGIINVGGDKLSVYSFAKKHNPKILRAKASKKLNLPFNQTMNLTKLKKIIDKNK